MVSKKTEISKKKKLVLLHGNIETEHLGKDVFLAPYYLSKIHNLDCHIIYSISATNKDIPRKLRSVTLVPYNNYFRKNSNELVRGFLEIIYTLFHAKQIDVLMRFYFSDVTAIIGVIYKKLNKNGILYIKCDGKMGEWPLLGYYNSTNLENKKIRQAIRKKIYETFLKGIDLITIETKKGYEEFFNKKLFNINIENKVQLMYSGFDKELFEEYNMKRKKISEKENIILTVGRLGTYQKNTEMVLHAVERLNLKNWKLILVGPIEKNEQDFQKIIDAFYVLNPHLKDNVIFIGPVYDKKELWEWYNRAKIFVLTSIYESFGIVLVEALFFKNYIISTDVGAAKELIQLGYGETITQKDSVYLADSLQKIINRNNLEEMYNRVNWIKNDISWEKFINDATINLFI
jgi:glycosyltransferase involved in cell wall biosynthesis